MIKIIALSLLLASCTHIQSGKISHKVTLSKRTDRVTKPKQIIFDDYEIKQIFTERA